SDLKKRAVASRVFLATVPAASAAVPATSPALRGIGPATSPATLPAPTAAVLPTLPAPAAASPPTVAVLLRMLSSAPCATGAAARAIATPNAATAPKKVEWMRIIRHLSSDSRRVAEVDIRWMASLSTSRYGARRRPRQVGARF